MMKWIRWSGLAGFIVVVALIVALWFLALGPLMKMAIEKFGSDALGAQVNVEDISLGLSPLSLTITGVQLADKDTPMENLVSFDRAVATLAPLPLLLGHVIIDDMSLTGVALGTKRASSGALEIEESETSQQTNLDELKKTDTTANPKGQEKAQETDSISRALPSTEDILARETLLTNVRGEALKKAYKQHKSKIDNAVAKLPSEQTLKNYQKQLSQILTGKFKSLDDFNQRKNKFDALKAQLKQDKQAVANLKVAVKQGKSDLKQKWSALKTAPEQDLANLKQKYTLDSQGTANLAGLLFGEDVGEYAQTALEYYQKIKPLLVDEEEQAEIQQLKEMRLEGRFVHFTSDNPLPDFWIKSLNFTMRLPSINQGSAGQQPPKGEVQVTVNDITQQQEVINAPTRLSVIGNELQNIKNLTLSGVLDHRTSPGKDTFELRIDGWQIDNFKLGLAGLVLTSSTASVNANAAFVDEVMEVTGGGLFSQSKFDSKDTTFVAKEMKAALQQVSTFNITTVAKGKFASPKVSIRSDLDKQLSAAFDKRLKQKQAELESKLKNKLNQKLLAHSGDYSEQIKQLNLTEGSLEQKGKLLEKLGKQELASYEAQLKAELAAKKAKADARVRAEKAKAKAKLEAEKAKAKAKAKAEADKKKKELERKAKEKLKKLFG